MATGRRAAATRNRRPAAVAVAVTIASTLAACGGGSSGATRHAHRPAAATMVPAPDTTAPATTAPPTTAASPPSTSAPPATTAAPARSLADRLTGVGSAGQVLAVVAAGYGATTATVTAYQRSGGGWQQVFGPWTAHVGYGGFAPPGQKHEGDGRTPSGSYGFDFFFGVNADPGVRFAYRAVTGPSIVWDDDPASPLYNEWVDTSAQNAGANPEPMDNVPAYRYGAVIAYNDARTPGLGSAIFLHVSTGGATAGCVSLPEDELLSVLRWLDPAQQPRIVMGTTATVTS